MEYQRTIAVRESMEMIDFMAQHFAENKLNDSSEALMNEYLCLLVQRIERSNDALRRRWK